MQKLQLAVMPWHVGQRAGQMTCGAAPGTSQPSPSTVARGLALLEVDVLQRGVGKCRVLADGKWFKNDWTDLQFLFHGLVFVMYF